MESPVTPDTPREPEAEAVSVADVPAPENVPSESRRKSLATLTDPKREGELSLVERLYVDHSAGRISDHDAVNRLLSFAAGCDDDAYADENEGA